MSKLLSQTCRACLFPLNAATNVPIFSEYNSNNLLSNMIADTIHILLDPMDNLGENVCKFCADKIYNFYEFRQMFLESEKKLREHLEQLQKDGTCSIISASPNDEYDSTNETNIACDMDDVLEPTPDPSNNLRWKCSKCPKSFGRRIELQLHRHIHRIDTKTSETTSETQNGFGIDDEINIKSEPMLIDDHDWSEASHFMDDTMAEVNSEGEFRWVCNSCNCRFLRRAHLREHRRQHANERKQLPATKKILVKKHIPQIKSISRKSETFSISIIKPEHKKNLNATVAIDGSDRWMCKKCCLPFRTRRLLRDHNVVHRTNRSFITSGLDSTLNTTNESSLDNDLSIIQGAAAAADANAAKMESLISPSASASASALNVTKSSETRWKCPKCRKTFDTQKSLRKHKLLNHTFEIKLNLKSTPKHIKINSTAATSAKKLQNDIIKKKQLNRSPFVEREWPCNSCYLVFNRRNLLREHRRIVHVLKPNVLPLKQDSNAFSLKEEQSDESTVNNTL